MRLFIDVTFKFYFLFKYYIKKINKIFDYWIGNNCVHVSAMTYDNDVNADMKIIVQTYLKNGVIQSTPVFSYVFFL